jgi:hypothetical protein
MKYLILLLPCVFIFSCASKHSSFGRDFDASTLSKGMTQQEVLNKLGEPSKYSRQSRVENQDAQVAMYHFQSPTNNGKYLFKELTVVYVNNRVKDLNFRERILLKPMKGARVSNRILDVAGPKLDF